MEIMQDPVWSVEVGSVAQDAMNAVTRQLLGSGSECQLCTVE